MCSTGPHPICEANWNLPVFLLRDQYLTLMYMAFLMVFVMLCTSLPNIEKYSILVMTSDIGMVIDGGRGSKCSLGLSQWSLQISLHIPHQNPYYHTYTCRLLHFSVWCCPYPWELPGASWWGCLFKMDLELQPNHRHSWSFHLNLWCMVPKCILLYVQKSLHWMRKSQ